MNQNDQLKAQKIRAQYVEKEPTDLDTLRELDRKVRRPAAVFSYVFGSISAVVMGAGMSLVMTDIGATLGLADTMIPGIAIGIVGMFLVLINYPIYKGILNSRKKKYSSQILNLCDKMTEK